MLLSSGGFAIYRGYSADLQDSDSPASARCKAALIVEKIVRHLGLRSKGFRRTGLDAGAAVRPQILNECRTGGDFIRVVMDCGGPAASNGQPLGRVRSRQRAARRAT